MAEKANTLERLLSVRDGDDADCDPVAQIIGNQLERLLSLKDTSEKQHQNLMVEICALFGRTSPRAYGREVSLLHYQNEATLTASFTHHVGHDRHNRSLWGPSCLRFCWWEGVTSWGTLKVFLDGISASWWEAKKDTYVDIAPIDALERFLAAAIRAVVHREAKLREVKEAFLQKRASFAALRAA